jgi:2-(1,2-epoxy-1,2-dihydrophenyl)acetyl-CoA isomerase
MAITSIKHGDVVEVAIDFPQVRNALGRDEGQALLEALQQAMADAATGVIVISGRGKAFCAGGNLPQIVALAEAGGSEAVRHAIYGTFQTLARAVRESPIPVIAAVDGPAVGFGCDLALACDITLIGRNGWLGQGWIKAGLIPATGGALYAARRAGAQAVWRLLTTERVDAATAESWGLAIACDGALEQALAMAKMLAEMPRAPLRAMARLSRIEDTHEHMRAALDYQVGFFTDPGFAEATRQRFGG